ncbi:hypothetical protein Tco_0281659 [Tanacetum coccineum]
MKELGDEEDSEFSDDDNDDVEKYDKDESDEDDIYKYKIRVRKDKDVEMKDAKAKESDKGEEKVTDAAKEEAKKTLEAKDDTKKIELPPLRSSLSVSSVAKLEKDVSELKTVDYSSEALVVLQSQVPIVFDSYLNIKVGDVFQKELHKHTADLIHKYSLHHFPKLTKKLTPTAEQESEKSPSDILKIKKETS